MTKFVRAGRYILNLRYVSHIHIHKEGSASVIVRGRTVSLNAAEWDSLRRFLSSSEFATFAAGIPTVDFGGIEGVNPQENPAPLNHFI
jgi:hypothetical protein